MKKQGVAIKRTVYSTFRGADFSTDPSLVERYRSPLCTNIIADGGGMPQKRDGWRVLHTSEAGKVNGLHCASFSGTMHMLAHIGTKLYKWDESTTPTQLATGLPDKKSRSAYLKGKLWIVTGGGYYVYDGTNATKVSAAGGVYVPTTVITRMPTGGGADVRVRMWW